jgi:REP element-mobilizing transposase RayT
MVMARIARIVVPAVPHHVTQRGNRRQAVFFGEDDYRAYLALLSEYAGKAGVRVWAWCLMPNHVHLMLAPPSAEALRAALAEAHRRYSRLINFREGWRGYLWQGRFASCPMDEAHALAAARYIELNPVRARLAATSRPRHGGSFWTRGLTTACWRRSVPANGPAGRLATPVSSRAWKPRPAGNWPAASPDRSALRRPNQTVRQD